MDASIHESDKRHSTLRLVASICTFIGGLMLVLGPLLLASTLHLILTANSTSPSPVPRGFGPPQTAQVSLVARLGATFTMLWSCGILLGGLQFLAAGGLIRLMIQLEENTRRTARLLERVRMRLGPAEESDGSMFVA